MVPVVEGLRPKASWEKFQRAMVRRFQPEYNLDQLVWVGNVELEREPDSFCGVAYGILQYESRVDMECDISISMSCDTSELWSAKIEREMEL